MCHDGKEGSALEGSGAEHGLDGLRVEEVTDGSGQALSRGEARILRGCLIY